ncbi:MAG: MAPEG family protein [Rhizobiaceae bacterium]|nr:MAPEG family protein [Rhizobiaceae bacterium]
MQSALLPSLSVELAYVALCAPLALAYIVTQAILTGGAGRRQPGEQWTGRGFRAEKALRNFAETFPIFAALALALAVSGKADWWSGLGAALYFWARVAYLPAYVAGVGRLRSAVWSVALAGMAIMFWQLAF